MATTRENRAQFSQTRKRINARYSEQSATREREEEEEMLDIDITNGKMVFLLALFARRSHAGAFNLECSLLVV